MLPLANPILNHKNIIDVQKISSTLSNYLNITAKNNQLSFSDVAEPSVDLFIRKLKRYVSFYIEKRFKY